MLIDLGFSPARIRRIYNGVDAAKYSQAPETDLRAELGVGPATPLVGMIGNIRLTKGHEYFIRAADRVLRQFPTATFVICGDGHAVLEPPLRELVAALGVAERVRFLGFRPDVAALLPQLDVFVLPSTSEGFPLVVLEAMAAGRPVVATRCGGVEEMIADGEDGITVPIGDAGQLAAGICCLLADPRRAALLGDNARRRMRRQFSTKGMVAGYEQLYIECVRNLGLCPAQLPVEASR